MWMFAKNPDSISLKGHWKYPKKVEINWNLDLGGKNKITDVFRFSEIALETT